MLQPCKFKNNTQKISIFCTPNIFQNTKEVLRSQRRDCGTSTKKNNKGERTLKPLLFHLATSYLLVVFFFSITTIMSGRFLVRAKNAWRKMWNLYERPSPYDDAPPKSSEMRYPSPAYVFSLYFCYLFVSFY